MSFCSSPAAEIPAGDIRREENGRYYQRHKQPGTENWQNNGFGLIPHRLYPLFCAYRIIKIIDCQVFFIVFRYFFIFKQNFYIKSIEQIVLLPQLRFGQSEYNVLSTAFVLTHWWIFSIFSLYIFQKAHKHLSKVHNQMDKGSVYYAKYLSLKG